MSAKAAARQARKLAKDEKRIQKQVAAGFVPAPQKLAVIDTAPKPKKIPAVAITPKQAAATMKPEWLFDEICCCFPDEWAASAWEHEIEPKLQSYGCLNWVEIGQQKDHKNRPAHHDMPIKRLTKEAQEQLNNTDRDGFHTMYRFALDRHKRLWGFREIPRFSIVWYDPEHKVYPTKVR